MAAPSLRACLLPAFPSRSRWSGGVCCSRPPDPRMRRGGRKTGKGGGKKKRKEKFLADAAPLPFPPAFGGWMGSWSWQDAEARGERSALLFPRSPLPVYSFGGGGCWDATAGPPLVDKGRERWLLPALRPPSLGKPFRKGSPQTFLSLPLSPLSLCPIDLIGGREGAVQSSPGFFLSPSLSLSWSPWMTLFYFSLPLVPLCVYSTHIFPSLLFHGSLLQTASLGSLTHPGSAAGDASPWISHWKRCVFFLGLTVELPLSN